MTIWKYKEEKDTYLLVKLYKENHGEGEYLGDFSEEEIKKIILDINPNARVGQAYGTLAYFGFVPLLVLKN